VAAGLGAGAVRAGVRENELHADLLPELTETDLVTLGLPFGPRKKLLKAIAALREGNLPSPTLEPPEKTASASASPSATERRQLTVMFCDLVGEGAAQEQAVVGERRSSRRGCRRWPIPAR
jgi:hypothetical protein